MSASNPATATPVAADDSYDGALRLFGAIRIYISLLVGSLVAVLAVAAFVYSFYADTGLVKTSGVVESVDCSSPRTQRTCVRPDRSTETCTERTVTDCTVRVRVDDRVVELPPYTVEQKNAPRPGDQTTVYVDPSNPQRVKREVLTDSARSTLRLVAAIVALVAAAGVAFLFRFRKDRNLRRIEGGLGVIDAVASIG